MALVIVINNAIVLLAGVNIVFSPGKRVTVLFFARSHKATSYKLDCRALAVYLRIGCAPQKFSLSRAAQEFVTFDNHAAPRKNDVGHAGDLDAFAKKLREAGVAFEGPTPGSRARPDGKVLHWKTINLADTHHGLLPFFIEWSADSAHPSTDAPQGCTLDYFEVMSTNPDELTPTIQRMGIDLPIARSDKSRIHALLTGPKGELGLTS